MNKIKNIEKFYDNIASKNDYWRKKNSYYHKKIVDLYKFLIPKGKKIIEIGSGTGELLAKLSPLNGVGLDISGNMVKIAKKKYPKLKFIKQDASQIKLNEPFEYVILSDLIGNLIDVQNTFEQLSKIINPSTRIIINYYNYFWNPFLHVAEKLNLKMPQPIQSWLSSSDVKNFLELSNLEIIKESKYLLIPIDFPFISDFVNKYVARLPLVRNLSFVTYLIARQKPNTISDKEYSVSVIIPARNESGNIETAVLEIPQLGKNTEIVFVEGHSKDNTKEEIERVIKKYNGKKNITLVNQGIGSGKADAVRKGIAKSTGDMIIIFDADLTVSPADLPKFYQAIRTRKAEFIQGSRLVYPMEKEAMRLLNTIGNKFFGTAFSFLLDQRIKDTLCGTKAIFRTDYESITANRSYFGDFDPFGDFDLIFGSSKLNLSILEIPIRYKARTYGTTNISRFRHGWLLLKMTLIAAKKIKFF